MTKESKLPKVNCTVSLSPEMVGRLDKKAEQIAARNGGIPVSRSALIENLLAQAMGAK